MKISTFISAILLTVLNSYGQTNYKEKEKEAMAFNLLVGYQTFPNQDDINAEFVSNGFTKLRCSPLSLGFEFAISAPRSIGKFQFKGTSIFTSKKVHEMTSQSASLSFQYGYDLLRNSPKTYFYPFAGLRLLDWTIFGKSNSGKSLSASKKSFDFLTGLGLKQFLNDDLHGVFNNVDLTIGLSVPLTNGKWKALDNTDASFISGLMKNSFTYFVTLSIGRGFRPATIK